MENLCLDHTQESKYIQMEGLDAPYDHDAPRGNGEAAPTDTSASGTSAAASVDAYQAPRPGTRLLFQTSGSVLRPWKPVVLGPRPGVGQAAVSAGQRRLREASLPARNAATAMLLHSNHLAMLGPFLSHGALSLASAPGWSMPHVGG